MEFFSAGDIVGGIVAVLAVCLVGLVAGAETATLLIHEALDRLPFRQGLPSAQAVNHRIGGAMPVVMPVTILVCLAAGLTHLRSVAALLFFVGTAALVVMLLITFIGLAPLNKLEDAATVDTPEADWQQWRRQWMARHRGRVICDVVALVSVAIAVAIA